MDMQATISIPYAMTKRKLVEALDSVPDEATLSIRTTPGDRPWESETTSLTCNWKT